MSIFRFRLARTAGSAARVAGVAAALVTASLLAAPAEAGDAPHCPCVAKKMVHAKSVHAKPRVYTVLSGHVPVKHKAHYAVRQIHVMSRRGSGYTAPAYLASSRAPTVVYDAPFEAYTDGGSVVGPAPIKHAPKVVIGKPIVRYIYRSHHHGLFGHHYGHGYHHGYGW